MVFVALFTVQNSNILALGIPDFDIHWLLWDRDLRQSYCNNKDLLAATVMTAQQSNSTWTQIFSNSR